MNRILAMRARGATLQEIGRATGLSFQQVARRLDRHPDNPGKVTLWEIDSGAELDTFIEARGEVHMHASKYRDGKWRWFAVHRRTRKCGTRQCWRKPVMRGA